MSGSALTFSSVCVNLDGQQILQDISFEVKAGTIHSIVGPNGAGKSTLVKAILGQNRFTGHIRLGNDRAVIGYVPQSLDIDRSLPLTVKDVLATMVQRRPAFLGMSATQKGAVLEMLDQMGLAGRLNAMFGALSGGERQRLLFGQALLQNPDLLIMDEPTANMDRAGTHLVEKTVSRLTASGTTVLWVSHDWGQVRRLAHVVTGIRNSVHFSGPPSQVLSDGAFEEAA